MATAASLLRRLADACGVAVSVVRGATPLEPPRLEPGADPAASLDALVAACPGYCWATVHARPAVFPDERPWRAPVDVDRGRPRPRAEAADALLRELAQRCPELADMGGVVVKGDPSAPIFTDPVQLGGRDEVIGHLVALLGDDDSLAFALERAAAGPWVLHFDAVGGGA
jgi:hypothetical protein